MRPSFARFGPERPRFPAILSVPHAGRDYPQSLLADCRATPSQLVDLEDRLADLLVTDAAQMGFSGLVAQTPRAIIDLNRSEDEVDPAMLSDPPARTAPLSVKTRGGLGLVPRRTAALGELWKRRFSSAEIESRLALHHRPYHAALANLLRTARADFGTAILIDVHSMPPLPDNGAKPAPQIVIGDRFGRSADPRFSAHACILAEGWGFRVARNAPYAGGHILDRHAAPSRGLHGLQIEIDRRLYLDAGLTQAGEMCGHIAQFVGALAQSLAQMLDAPSGLLAAE